MNYLDLLIPFLVGLVLGAFYFGGLWLTVSRLSSLPRPGWVLLVSFLVRLAVLLTGIYLIAEGKWQRMCACLFGFILVRFVSIQITHSELKKQG